MRETRLSGLEGRARSIPCPYPYPIFNCVIPLSALHLAPTGTWESGVAIRFPPQSKNPSGGLIIPVRLTRF